MGKIITFFNHKGEVGKTTLVHNLGFIFADKGCKVLLIDADPQMNLTSAIYGLSTSVEYSTDEQSKWSQNIEKYISLAEYIDIELKGLKCAKKIYQNQSKINSKGYVETVDVTKENGQYAISLNSIKDSYSNIVNNLMRLA